VCKYGRSNSTQWDGRGGGVGGYVDNKMVRKMVRLVLIIFNETAALFMMNMIRGTSQLNIDILIYSSRREFDV
jgi:hypothetical protein